MRSPRWRRALEILVAACVAPVLVVLAARKLHGNPELVRVGDDQVAVILDRWSGETHSTSAPGYQPRIPWLHEITLLERSPQTLVVKPGSVNASPPSADPNAKHLVRSSDGSSFRIAEIAVQIAIQPEAAATVIDELGSAPDAAHAIVGAHARSILRDELGRATAEEISRGERTQEVVGATTARLQAAMAPHGIAILGVSFTKPAFDEVYEDTIGRTKTFRQQADELAERTGQIERSRPSREASVAKKKELELAKLEGDLVRDRGAALRDARIAKQEADDVYRTRVSEGEATRLEKEAQAALLKAKNVAAARDVLRDGVDLEAAGDLPVRKALVEKLGEIQIDLVPRPRDGEATARSGSGPGGAVTTQAVEKKPR